MNPLTQFKAVQREAWSHFAPLEAITMLAAPALVRFAQIGPGEEVLDVGCGTGVVAVTAARVGARVRGLDLTPALLERARDNATLAGLSIDFGEGDAEALPYPDATFDVVVSQFGHMFAPRHDVATRELLRVLRPGGRVAFSTWPPELFVAQMMACVGRHLPAPPPEVMSPTRWGDPGYVRERLGEAVTDLRFHCGVISVPALSLSHYRASLEHSVGPLVLLVAALQGDPQRLAGVRAELETLASAYFADNKVEQHFMMTRARKR
jgi:SAM-dependent methyltransferase